MNIRALALCLGILSAVTQMSDVNAEPSATARGAMRPLVIAHRGGRRWAPENTLASFQRSLDLGADGIELDIHRCKSGELVVIHDDKVDRTTNGHGFVKDKTLAELKGLDAGSWYKPEFKDERIPLLSEVLNAVNGRLLINIEMKNTPVKYDGLDDELIKLLSIYKYPERIIVSSFDHQILKQFHQKAPQYKTAFLDEAIPGDIAGYATAIGASAWNPDVDTVRPDTVVTAHSGKVGVNVWTANSPEQWKRLEEMRVDGIITDDPAGLMQFQGRSPQG